MAEHNSKVVIEVAEDGKVGILIRNIHPFDAARLLVEVLSRLLDGDCNMVSNDGPPLTPAEEEEIIAGLITPDSPKGGH